MTQQIQSQIKIQASAENVWNALLDFQSYPLWNPFITKIVGEPIVGTSIKVTLIAPNSHSMIFKPTIIENNPNESFIWNGKLFLKGLFDGKHIFQIKQNEDNSCTFIQREIFSGLLIRFFNPTNTKMGFELMNKALKEYVESRCIS